MQQHHKSELHRFSCMFALFALIVLVIPACSKENTPEGAASLSIVNAVLGSSMLATNFSSNGPVPYISSKKVYYKNFSQFNAYSGTQRVRLYNYPDTLPRDQPVFDVDLRLPDGSIHTLFLSGTRSAPDTLLVDETIPYFPANDSAMAIRFINLSPGAEPISVNIKGQANGSEASALAYKQVTSFETYAANASLTEYVFEFRNAVSGDLLASYTTTGSNATGTSPYNPNKWRYRSFTLVLAGKPGGAGSEAQTVFIVNHY
jgi:hypothetical protein